MKKFICFFVSTLIILGCLFCFTSCSKTTQLENNLCELRSDIFTGKLDDISINACYGFRETPFGVDNKINQRVYALQFKLLNLETTDTTYSIKLNFLEKEYSAQFKLHPVTHSLTAFIEIENFNSKEFSVLLCCGDDQREITLSSIVPKNTLSYTQALESLQSNCPDLIKSFKDENGTFLAEVFMRIIVKNDKAYWYVGLAKNKDYLKALLIDGATGEVLAIREVL